MISQPPEKYEDMNNMSILDNLDVRKINQLIISVDSFFWKGKDVAQNNYSGVASFIIIQVFVFILLAVPQVHMPHAYHNSVRFVSCNQVCMCIDTETTPILVYLFYSGLSESTEQTIKI